MLAAMGVGTLLGRSAAARGAIERLHVGNANVLLTLALMAMMVPPLARAGDRPATRGIGSLIGPLALLGLAVLFLRNHPQFMAGVALVGLGGCIGPTLTGAPAGHPRTATLLAAIDGLLNASVIGLCALLVLDVLPPLARVNPSAIHVRVGQVARAVGLYFGVPFAVAATVRIRLLRSRGRARCARTFLPMIAPAAPLGLTLAIGVLFALNGRAIVDHPRELPLVAIPLCLHFAASGRRPGRSNHAGFAVALAVGLFGANHGAPVAAAIGPLVEVPAILAFAGASRRFRGPRGAA